MAEGNSAVKLDWLLLLHPNPDLLSGKTICKKIWNDYFKNLQNSLSEGAIGKICTHKNHNYHNYYIMIMSGCFIFLTINGLRWDQPISDISIFVCLCAANIELLLHRTHFIQNIWREWPKSSNFKILTAVATKTTSPLQS